MAALVSTEAAVRAGAALAVSLPAAPCRVLGDAVGLRRVLANLIDTALRYGRRCEVSLSSMRDVVTLIVDDDGPGIPPAEREAVLE
ncbi:ATP-binding protein, partial [Acinetobacter baumannii]